MVKQLHTHSQRDLSLCGKILLTKCLGISKLIHPISITVASKELLNKVQTQLNRFIWAFKPPKVKHTVMIGSPCQSGLGSIYVKWDGTIL